MIDSDASWVREAVEAWFQWLTSDDDNLTHAQLRHCQDRARALAHAGYLPLPPLKKVTGIRVHEINIELPE